MYRYYLVSLVLLLGNTATADQLDGLADINLILTLLGIGVIHVFILFFAIIGRFTRRDYKVSVALNYACIVLMLVSFVEIMTLGESIDPGFLATCMGVIVITAALILLNYRVGISRKKEED